MTVEIRGEVVEALALVADVLRGLEEGAGEPLLLPQDIGAVSAGRTPRCEETPEGGYGDDVQGTEHRAAEQRAV